jgi:hypothetical protein
MRLVNHVRFVKHVYQSRLLMAYNEIFCNRSYLEMTYCYREMPHYGIPHFSKFKYYGLIKLETKCTYFVNKVAEWMFGFV